MKKVNARIKPKSIKRSSGKAYIVAATVSAVLCATLFSFMLKPGDELPQEVEIDVTEIKPEEIAQVSEPIEIEVPSTTEIVKAPEPEIDEPQTEVIETGIFGSENIKIMMPVSGEIINDYSGSKPVKSKTMGDWRVHSGIDIGCSAGSEVKAPHSGKVIALANNKLTGNTLSIDYGNGFVSTLYSLDRINVSVGDEIEKGDVLGIVGNNSPLEANEDLHLHFELKKDGNFVNPIDYVK